MCALPSKILEHGQSFLRNTCVHFHSEIYRCLHFVWGFHFCFFSWWGGGESHYKGIPKKEMSRNSKNKMKFLLSNSQYTFLTPVKKYKIQQLDLIQFSMQNVMKLEEIFCFIFKQTKHFKFQGFY